MQRNLIYFGIFVAAVVLQIFIFDNISLSVYFHPLVYVAFIVLLPLSTPSLWVLLLSTLMGLCIDLLTGMGGLNVIASAAVGFMRPWLLKLTCGHTIEDDAALSLYRLTNKNLAWFIASIILLHSFIYFTLEALSVQHFLHTLLRIMLSDVVAGAIVWYFTKLFIDKVLNK